jgi:hypothetical protein
MPVILAIQEVEAEGSGVQGQPRQKGSETLSQKQNISQKGLGV